MRYTSDGPTGRLGASIIPVPARLGQGYQSWGQVNGNPGVDPIPAPRPAAVPQGVRYGVGSGTHTSEKAPPYWTPGVYYQPQLASRFHGAINSDNQMPVPARLPNGQIGFVATTNNMPYIAARRPVFLRQQQVGWPMAQPSYSWRS